MVAERRTRGRSVLIISHFIPDEQRFDRIIKLSDGRTRTWSV
jgi:ABC-type multidrug transport system ATPase subunit